MATHDLIGMNSSHYRFDKPGALCAVRPKAPLAPEHARPQGSLSRMVGRLHPLAPHERPPGIAQLVEARYPNALEEVTPAEFYSDRDAEQAIKMARVIAEAVQGRMGAEAASED